jgi:hypothetical protein
MQKIIHFSNLSKNLNYCNKFFIINCDGSVFKNDIIYRYKNLYLTVDRYKLIKHCYKYNKKKEDEKKKTINLKKFLIKFDIK